MNKRIFAPTLMLVLSLACGGIATTAAPDQPSVETVVAATFQAMTQEAANNPAPTSEPGGLAVNFQNVSFTIPPGLAASVQSAEIIPRGEASDDVPYWAIYPEFTQFTLARTHTFPSNFELVIRVIPAEEYQQMSEAAAEQIPILQQKLASNDYTGVGILPPFNAALIIDVQQGKIDFPNGSGIRSLQEYHQSYAPITNDYLIYSFQGITQDGKYYVSVIAPIRAPVLVDETYFPDSTTPTPTIPEGGVPFDMPAATFDAQVIEQYNQAVSDALNQLTEDQFTPSISTLDALVQSILIQ